MTLIIAMVSKEGIVMAADSASTDFEANTKQPTDEKISHFKEPHLLYGTSGDVGLSQKIKHRMKKLAYQPDVFKLRSELKGLIVPELTEAKRTHVPYPSDPMSGLYAPPPHIGLACGYARDVPYLIEYERDGRDTDYAPENMGGFAAIGSGKTLAHALYRPHFHNEKGLAEARVICYRIVEDAIEVSAYGLSKPIHMYEISPQGKCEKLSQEELTAVSHTVQLWREIEHDGLGKALAPSQPTDKKTELPSMETGDS